MPGTTERVKCVPQIGQAGQDGGVHLVAAQHELHQRGALDHVGHHGGGGKRVQRAQRGRPCAHQPRGHGGRALQHGIRHGHGRQRRLQRHVFAVRVQPHRPQRQSL